LKREEKEHHESQKRLLDSREKHGETEAAEESSKQFQAHPRCPARGK
jgi:hypothetical protein